MMMVLFGPPGVGKGTQADQLNKEYNFVKFSMGDVLREEVSLSTPLGDEIEQYLNRGVLAPDEVVLELVENFLFEHRTENILFDGFPRTLNQAINFQRVIARLALTLNLALEMHVDETELIKRLVNRRYCPQCGRIYNYITNPPTNDDVCDVCGHTLEKRKDDEESIIRKRLQVYEEETRPLTDYYASLNIYRRVDAYNSPEKVFKKISEIVDGYINKK
jgi:adenylate kinase